MTTCSVSENIFYLLPSTNSLLPAKSTESYHIITDLYTYFNKQI